MIPVPAGGGMGCRARIAPFSRPGWMSPDFRAASEREDMPRPSLGP
jgi:hypothetical protein